MGFSSLYGQVTPEQAAMDSLVHERQAIIDYRYGPKWGPVLGYRGLRSNFLELGVTRAGGRHGLVGWEATVYSNLSNTSPLHGLSVGHLVGFAFFEVGARAKTMFGTLSVQSCQNDTDECHLNEGHC